MLVICSDSEGDRDIRTNKRSNLVPATLETLCMCFNSNHNNIIKRKKVNQSYISPPAAKAVFKLVCKV